MQTKSMKEFKDKMNRFGTFDETESFLTIIMNKQFIKEMEKEILVRTQVLEQKTQVLKQVKEKLEEEFEEKRLEN